MGKGFGDSFPAMLDDVGTTSILIVDADRKELIRKEFEAKIGANYEVLFQRDDAGFLEVNFVKDEGKFEELDSKSLNCFQPLLIETVTEPNTVHIFFLLPQYFVMTAAEILFAISILRFSYTEV